MKQPSARGLINALIDATRDHAEWVGRPSLCTRSSEAERLLRIVKSRRAEIHKRLLAGEAAIKRLSAARTEYAD